MDFWGLMILSGRIGAFARSEPRRTLEPWAVRRQSLRNTVALGVSTGS